MIKHASNSKQLRISVFLLSLLSILPADMSYAITIKERQAAELERLEAEKVAKQQVVTAKAEQKRQARAKKAAEKKRAEEEAKRLAAQRPAIAEKSSVQKNNAIEPEMVAIKGGCFMMGSPDTEKERKSDETQHQVCVEDFSIGKYEVTQAQWQAIMDKNDSKNKGDNLPVENVSYNDVQDFISKLNAQTGQSYRLPTEAEWEYAARAKTTTPFYTGNCINTQQANYNGNYDYNDCGAKTGVYKEQIVAIGSYPANPWCLYDMAGNVWEWTCSAYDKDYGGSEKQCASNNDANTQRVIRGGSGNFDPDYMRSAYRNYIPPGISSYYLGFRLSKM